MDTGSLQKINRRKINCLPKSITKEIQDHTNLYILGVNMKIYKKSLKRIRITIQEIESGKTGSNCLKAKSLTIVEATFDEVVKSITEFLEGKCK